MKQYEVTFIVDPVLSGDEIKATAKTYEDFIKNNSGEIVHIDEMGLRQLAYSIKKRNSGIYFTIEYKVPTGEMIDSLELAMRRDERVLRFLTVYLDKYGIKYNDDKRNGLIGKVKKKEKKEKRDNRRDRRGGRDRNRNDRGDQNKKPEQKAAPAETAPAPKEDTSKEG